MYIRCLFIRKSSPAASDQPRVPDMMSAVLHRNIRDRRAILLLGSISHRPALVERLYWFPRPPECERSKPPNAVGARSIPAMRVVKVVSGTESVGTRVQTRA